MLPFFHALQDTYMKYLGPYVFEGEFVNLGDNGDYKIRNLEARAKKKKAQKEVEEAIIARFSKDIQLHLEIVTRTTQHADIRQDQRSISDKDIEKTVYKAVDKIMQAFTDGSIKQNEKLHIYDPANEHLNLIVVFSMNEGGTPEKVSVVTAIRERNFHANKIKRTFKV